MYKGICCRLNRADSSATFLFDTIGAKMKTGFASFAANRYASLRFQKENAIDISRSAEREEGYAPSTAQTFEKV